MPVLAFSKLVREPTEPGAVDTFLEESRELISEIEAIARTDRLTGPAMLHRLLLEGPCSGPWRVFHAATNPEPVPSSTALPFDQDWFLGVRVGKSNSVKLGQLFDEWVTEANEES